MQSISSKKWNFIFFALLICIAIAYNYQSILFQRPYSLHQWRQCDCLSIALNYYHGGMHFFSPVINWCGPNGDGKVSTSESPIIYYTVARLWKIFGYHEFIYRLLILCISFTGLFFLYRLANLLLHDALLSIMLSLFLFASPIFAFYANNFLPDLPALCFTIIAWYCFVCFIKTSWKSNLRLSAFFFMLAGLTKLSAVIAFMPVLLLFPIEMLGWLKLNNGKKIFDSPLKQFRPFFFAIVIILLWTIHAINYNKRVGIRVFSTQMFPIWQMNSVSIHNVLKSLFSFLLPQFYSVPALIVILAIFIALVALRRKVNSFMFYITICLLLGVLGYILLWFQVLDVHDYYLINLLVFVPCVLITFLHYLKNNHHEFFSSIKLKIFFGIFLSFNLYYTAFENRAKYPNDNSDYGVNSGHIMRQKDVDSWDWFHWHYNQTFRAYETIEDYNRNLGINQDDKVISIPDNSVNVSLYLMNQKGFTDYYYPTMGDLTRLKQYIVLGAKYLFVNDTSFIRKDWLKPYLVHQIGTYQNISIYNLQPHDILTEALKGTKQSIRSDSSWISEIRAKAMTKHISVDSMLTLDALWTLKNIKK